MMPYHPILVTVSCNYTTDQALRIAERLTGLPQNRLRLTIFAGSDVIEWLSEYGEWCRFSWLADLEYRRRCYECDRTSPISLN